jgi:hypothetical protein
VLTRLTQGQHINQDGLYFVEVHNRHSRLEEP